jgi:hypothetical protein
LLLRARGFRKLDGLGRRPTSHMPGLIHER